jgi:hypothetical protein
MSESLNEIEAQPVDRIVRMVTVPRRLRLAKRARNTHICEMLTKTGLQNRRVQFAADAAKAMEEYLAEREAVRVRTARLRALRLERDAAVAAAEAAEQAKEAAEHAKKVVAIKKKVMDVSQASAKTKIPASSIDLK